LPPENKTVNPTLIRRVRYPKPKSLHGFTPTPLFLLFAIETRDCVDGAYADDRSYQRLENPVYHALSMPFQPLSALPPEWFICTKRIVPGLRWRSKARIRNKVLVVLADQ
jgi:hypothetical protein